MRHEGLLGGKYCSPGSKACGYLGHLKIRSIVRSMLMLGGSEACPPGKFLKK